MDTSTTRDCVKFLDIKLCFSSQFRVSIIAWDTILFCRFKNYLFHVCPIPQKTRGRKKWWSGVFFRKDILLWHRKRLWLEKNVHHHKCNDEVFFLLYLAPPQLKLSGAFWAAIISPIWNWKLIIIGFICLFLLPCQSRTTYFTLKGQHMSACYISHTWYYKIRFNKIRVCNSCFGVCVFCLIHQKNIMTWVVTSLC